MTWDGCSEVERAPGKMGGRPVIRGTRIEPETLLLDAELGATPDEMHESFPTVSMETIQTILAFAHRA